MDRARMRSRLASEWEGMRWDWDLQVGAIMLDQLKAGETVDPAGLAAVLPNSYLATYRTDRDELAEVIDRAIGGETLTGEPSAPSVSVTVHGDNYSFNLGAGAQIHGDQVNVGGGVQIVVDVNASKEDLLSALQAVVASGLQGQWNPEAALAVGRAVEERGELSVAEVRGAVLELGQSEGVERPRVEELIEKVAVGGFGTFLATALGAGLGDLLHLIG
jgi:hypothetical protein